MFDSSFFISSMLGALVGGLVVVGLAYFFGKQVVVEIVESMENNPKLRELARNLGPPRGAAFPPDFEPLLIFTRVWGPCPDCDCEKSRHILTLEDHHKLVCQHGHYWNKEFKNGNA